MSREKLKQIFIEEATEIIEKMDIDIYVEMSGVTPGQASELVEMAHQVCPYSKATRNNVEVRLHSIAK